MAGDGLENDWRRMTIADPHYPVSRSLDSSRQNPYSGNGVVYANDTPDLEPGGLNICKDPPPLVLPEPWIPDNEDSGSIVLSPTHIDRPQEEPGRSRTKSISFDPEARLDDGQLHALDRPLPRIASLKSVSTADRPNSMRRARAPAPIEFDPETCKINPFTGEVIFRRTRRTGSSSTSISKMGVHDHQQSSQALADANLASLTSGTTASPPRDEVRTPISPVGSYISSPTVDSTPALSPSLEAEAWPAFRSGSVRSSRTLPSSRPMSLRRESRRTSRRSGSTTSFSPASAFLSKWGRDSLASVAPEPDDEGQSFGISGEYVVGRQIGYGGFSVVKEAFSIDESGEKKKHAVKIVRKIIQEKPDADNERCQQELEHEVGIWKYLSHPHILSLHAVYDTDFATFCVMDLNEGGSLYGLVRDQRKTPEKILPAATAQSYSFQLACALRYLHQDVRVVHRDVKMENCLIDRDRSLLGTAPGHLRLCDFGLADFISSDAPATNMDPGNAANVVGSLAYAAPEAMKTESAILSPTVDIWAYGVCVFTLVTGDRPFKHSMASKLVDLIERAEWDEKTVAECTADGEFAAEIMDLLRACLHPDPLERWTITQVLQSPWFVDCGDPFAMM